MKSSAKIIIFLAQTASVGILAYYNGRLAICLAAVYLIGYSVYWWEEAWNILALFRNQRWR